MKKKIKLGLIKTFLMAILILSIAVTIIGDGDTWTPLMTLFAGGLLYGERKINAGYYERKKNARSAGTHTSNKVLPFSKLPKTIIQSEKRKVK